MKTDQELLSQSRRDFMKSMASVAVLAGVDGYSSSALDAQDVSSSRQGGKPKIVFTENEHGVVSFSNGNITVSYDTNVGMFDIVSKDGGRLSRLYAAVQTDRVLRSQDFKSHTRQPLLAAVHDGFGTGKELTIINASPGLPSLTQRFVLYDDGPFVVIDAEIKGDKAMSTRHFDVMASDALNAQVPGATLPQRILQVPYDNDMWVRFNALPIAMLEPGQRKSSAETTAIYDDVSRGALVVGSITHDVWKTAIDFDGADGHLVRFNVYGGISSPGDVRSITHDSQPHGKVTGSTIASPKIYVGFARDWRDGLEAYGRANAIVRPPLLWKAPLPFGWNSWAAYGKKVSYTDYVGVAQFVHDELMSHGFENGGIVYINFDSFWKNLTDKELADSILFLRKLTKNSSLQMRPGIYWTPFATWSNDLDAPVEGTQGKYRYRDILLKGHDGALLPKLAHSHAIDPTNPGAQLRMDFYIKQFLDLGFQYIKLDFLTHGALEGAHWDPAVETGSAAYIQGMECLLRQIDGRMFVSLSIAPLFPSGLGHARRISCDAKGHMSGENQSTEYMLNSLSYGWWTNGPLYIADPDCVVLGPKANQGARSLNEGKSRLFSAVISGGMILDGSNLTDDPMAKLLAEALYTNPRINRIAAEGRAFRPLEGNSGDRAENIFVRDDRAGGMYVAIFNFDDSRTAHIDVLLERLSPQWTAKSQVNVTDVWSNKTHKAKADGRFQVKLQPQASTLLQITNRDGSKLSGQTGLAG